MPLPPDYAPALVTPEQAATVHARLRLNQTLATPHAPTVGQDGALLRGLALCGYCGARLGVSDPRSRRPGVRRAIYKCRRGQKTNEGCQHHNISAGLLDRAVWGAVVALIQDPALIEAEVARRREQPDPGADTLASIDRQVADLDRRIRNKRAYAEQVDDARERSETAAEVTALCRQRDGLTAERLATAAHYADAVAQADGLADLLAACQRVAWRLDTFTPAEQRRAAPRAGGAAGAGARLAPGPYPARRSAGVIAAGWQL